MLRFTEKPATFMWVVQCNLSNIYTHFLIFMGFFGFQPRYGYN